MQYIADLHIHSKYSRACSPKLTLENIAQYCAIKGVDLVATSDFTHPAWFSEIKNKLEESAPGIYKLKGSEIPTRFLISTEVSCIYSKNNKTRRLHILLFSPNIETSEKLNYALNKIGKLASDGRPILGLDAKKLARIVFDISPECMVIPAHCWTPWYAIFGSKSGFNSVEECFEEYTNQIYALETGLSSDPAMNWRLSALDKYTLVSHSDAHSLPNIGREANVFDLPELTYQQVCEAIKTKDKNKFLFTIEFYPEEGMYHYDGHRVCNVCFKPSQTRKLKGICPKCKKPLTVGVLSRVEELADREEGFIPPNSIPYKSLVPLKEIISNYLGKGKASKSVEQEYENLIKKGKNEFNILLNLSWEELLKITNKRIAEGIIKVRKGEVKIEPGYDGVYGKVKIFEDKKEKQKSIF